MHSNYTERTAEGGSSKKGVPCQGGLGPEYEECETLQTYRLERPEPDA